MIVTLDGHKLEREFTPGCTLQALLDGMQAELDARQLVVSVAVNGRTYPEQELAAALNAPLGHDFQVDLESGDRFAISADALRGVAAELAELDEWQAEVAGELNGGQVADALRQIGDLVQIWQQCRIVVVQCGALVGRDLLQEQVAGRAVAEHLAELVGRLRELRDALDARDMVLLADLIQYEMPGLCQAWHDVLLHLAASLGGAVPEAS